MPSCHFVSLPAGRGRGPHPPSHHLPSSSIARLGLGLGLGLAVSPLTYKGCAHDVPPQTGQPTTLFHSPRPPPIPTAEQPTGAAAPAPAATCYVAYADVLPNLHRTSGRSIVPHLRRHSATIGASELDVVVLWHHLYPSSSRTSRWRLTGLYSAVQYSTQRRQHRCGRRSFPVVRGGDEEEERRHACRGRRRPVAPAGPARGGSRRRGSPRLGAAAVGGCNRRAAAGVVAAARLRGRAAQEPALLRGAAVGAAAARPARHLARPLRPHRRPRARGGLGGRVLRRRRPRQVRPAHGLHRHHALLEPAGVRRRRRRRRRARPRARVHQVGHRLLHQGAHQARRALGRGRRRRHGPLLLAAAGGHDDVAAGVQGRPRPTRVRRRRRDRGRHGRRVHGVPGAQPALRQPPPPPRAAAVRVRRQVPGQVRQQHRGGEELLRLRQRLPRRAPLGRALAPPRHRTRRVPGLRRRQRRRLRRHRLGHHRVQLGRQVRRRPDPRRKAAAQRGALAAALGDAGAVQGEGGALLVRVPGQERRGRQRGAQPRRDAVRAAVEQHAVRDERRVPAVRLLGLPLVLRRRRRHDGSVRDVRGRLRERRRGVRAGPGAGGLRAGQQPARHELPGGLRRPVPRQGAPPRRLHRALQAQQGVHRLRAGLRRLVHPQGRQPQRRRRRHRRWSRPPGPLQGPQGELHADRGLHVQHGAHGRHVRHAQQAGPGRGAATATRSVVGVAARPGRRV